MKSMRKKKAEPGFEGRMEVRSATVVSPYLNPDVKGQQKERVQKNVRHDVLEFEFSRRHIDAIQKANGDWFLELCEQAILGGAQALDYRKAKVDTSFKPYAVPDSVISAIESLQAIERQIGRENYDLLVDTIFLGRRFKDIAFEKYGPFLTDYARRDSEGFVGRTWREQLLKLRDGGERIASQDWRDRHVNLNAQPRVDNSHAG